MIASLLKNVEWARHCSAARDMYYLVARCKIVHAQSKVSYETLYNISLEKSTIFLYFIPATRSSIRPHDKRNNPNHQGQSRLSYLERPGISRTTNPFIYEQKEPEIL